MALELVNRFHCGYIYCMDLERIKEDGKEDIVRVSGLSGFNTISGSLVICRSRE